MKNYETYSKSQRFLLELISWCISINRTFQGAAGVGRNSWRHQVTASIVEASLQSSELDRQEKKVGHSEDLLRWKSLWKSWYLPSKRKNCPNRPMIFVVPRLQSLPQSSFVLAISIANWCVLNCQDRLRQEMVRSIPVPWHWHFIVMLQPTPTFCSLNLALCKVYILTSCRCLRCWYCSHVVDANNVNVVDDVEFLPFTEAVRRRGPTRLIMLTEFVQVMPACCFFQARCYLLSSK